MTFKNTSVEVVYPINFGIFWSIGTKVPALVSLIDQKTLEKRSLSYAYKKPCSHKVYNDASTK